MYAGVLYTQPGWYSFPSWPQSDFTSLSRSATCTFLALPFFTAEMFLGQVVFALQWCIMADQGSRLEFVQDLQAQ